SGYVRMLMVSPAHRRRGIGRAMMTALARVFRDMGRTEWRLNVLVDNAAAIALYEGAGMRRAYGAAALVLPLMAVARLAMPAEAVQVVSVEPEHDAAIEERFAMPAGLLASLRGRSGEELVQLVREGE